MSERVVGSVNPVEAGIPTVFLEGYTQAISSVILPNIMAEASQIVLAHRPVDVPAEFIPTAFAKVLVVEDTQSWAAIHGRYAERAGHEVFTATSAQEAKKILEQGEIDLIVTDGLEDEWTQVHDAAQEKGINTVVVSGSSNVARVGNKSGDFFIDKIDSELVKKVEDLFGSI